MAYTITLPSGGTLTTVADGTVNTSSSILTLVGKNYAGYGQFLDQNFVNLLVNMANSPAPSVALTGQIYYNTTSGTLSVYTGTLWKGLARLSSASSAPAIGNTIPGELWYDSTNQQINVSNGNAWVLVGPTSTGGQGTTGAIAANVTDGTSSHVVTELYVANVLVGIISKDSTFSPNVTFGINSDWPAGQTISPGITLNSNIGNAPGVRAATSGFSIGASNISLTQSGTTALLLNNLNNGNILVQANVGGTVGNVIAVNGATGAVTIANLASGASGFSTAGNVTGGNILTAGLVSATGTITSAANVIGANITTAGLVTATGNVYGLNFVGNVVGTSSSALYADLAERFAADADYLPGTVVELGGSAEVTQATSELSESIFGVISTRPAYLMNSGAGHDLSHPPIAMTGRVPVRVVGAVRKGDRLVSAGNGIARAAQAGEATAFNVIGRALKDKLDTAEGTVEAIVTIK